jgi:cytidylate kinase
MYRAITLAALDAGIDPDDALAVAGFARTVSLTSGTDPSDPHIKIDERDVSTEIRGDDVTAAVSAVSAVPEVRDILVAMQREEVSAAQRAGDSIVVEGRDIGTVVLPDADLKIFLTADPAERARRRATQNEAPEEVTSTQEALLVRDAKDSTRAVSPLTRASDAIELDTTHMSLDEVVDAVLDLMREAT